MKILYLTRNDGTDTRPTKMCNSLARLGHDVVFLGWDRTPDKPKNYNLSDGVRRRILMRAGKHAQNSFEGWGDYVSHVVKALWDERPDAVQAINEEKAALVLPFKRSLYRWLIIDVFDSVIANRHKKKYLDTVAVWCRAVANAGADRIIETGPELQAMLGRHVRKSVVVENGPYDPGEQLSSNLPTGPAVRLAVGGTVHRKRLALDTLLEAVDLLPPGSVEIEASGWLFDDYSKEVFAKHPAVKYRWLASPRDFLDVASTCDALLYIRGDADESPYRAAVLPNRIFDCLAVGRPIVVNANLSLSKWVAQDGLGYVVKDMTAASLVETIKQIRAARSRLPEMAGHLRRIFLRDHTWEVMEGRLRALYENLGSRR